MKVIRYNPMPARTLGTLILIPILGFAVISVLNEHYFLTKLVRDPFRYDSSLLRSFDSNSSSSTTTTTISLEKIPVQGSISESSQESKVLGINSMTTNNISIDISETCKATFSAPQLWQRYLPKIIAASFNTDVPEHPSEISSQATQLVKLHSLLHDILPPSQLRKAARNLPSFQHETIEYIIEKVHKRMLDPDNNAPVQIVVFGGSVTLGRECYRSRKRLEEQTCNWPHRFELLINTLFENEVVKVTNLATGGTGTETGTRMVKYWMYPKDLKESGGPDIIINAYSTNTGIGANLDNKRYAMQDFIRAAIESKPCATPLLIVSVDDYLGNSNGANNNVLEELNYAIVLEQIAKWYDTVAISYAEVVRNIVYKDTGNSTFFTKGNVHFGHLAHQTVAWSVAFAFLELLENHCDGKHRESISIGKQSRYERQQHNRSVPILPPPLTNDLAIQNISEVWKASEDGAYQDALDVDCAAMNNTNRDPCITAWIAQNRFYGTQEILQFMRRHQTYNNGGWKVERNHDDGFAFKVGYTANTPNASFSLEFKDIAKDVKVVTIFFMRSYGEKWKDSKARFSVTSNNSTLAQHDIDGVHELEHSLTLIERFTLSKSVKKGETLSLKVDLISGSAFKVMGMTICRY